MSFTYSQDTVYADSFIIWWKETTSTIADGELDDLPRQVFSNELGSGSETYYCKIDNLKQFTAYSFQVRAGKTGQTTTNYGAEKGEVTNVKYSAGADLILRPLNSDGIVKVMEASETYYTSLQANNLLLDANYAKIVALASKKLALMYDVSNEYSLLIDNAAVATSGTVYMYLGSRENKDLGIGADTYNDTTIRLISNVSIDNKTLYMRNGTPTNVFSISHSSDDVTIQSLVNDKNLTFDTAGTGRLILNATSHLATGLHFYLKNSTTDAGDLYCDSSGTYLKAIESNKSLYLEANGSGKIELNDNTNLTGTLDVSGLLNAAGSINVTGYCAASTYVKSTDAYKVMSGGSEYSGATGTITTETEIVLVKGGLVTSITSR
jgi:hypothetical protein